MEQLRTIICLHQPSHLHIFIAAPYHFSAVWILYESSVFLARK